MPLCEVVDVLRASAHPVPNGGNRSLSFSINCALFRALLQIEANRLIFYTLRTLCRKHWGVPVRKANLMAKLFCGPSATIKHYLNRSDQRSGGRTKTIPSEPWYGHEKLGVAGSVARMYHARQLPSL